MLSVYFIPTFFFPEEEVRKKWKNIRDQFRAELPKIPVPKSGDGANIESHNSNWPYFKQLFF